MSSTDFTDRDVLMGRGAGPREHEGNVHFRSIVQTYKQAYSKASSRKEKNEIAGAILQKIQPGRFLEPVQWGDAWQQVDRERAQTKIKQALREAVRADTVSANTKLMTIQQQQQQDATVPALSHLVSMTASVNPQRSHGSSSSDRLWNTAAALPLYADPLFGPPLLMPLQLPWTQQQRRQLYQAHPPPHRASLLLPSTSLIHQHQLRYPNHATAVGYQNNNNNDSIHPNNPAPPSFVNELDELPRKVIAVSEESYSDSLHSESHCHSDCAPSDSIQEDKDINQEALNNNNNNNKSRQSPKTIESSSDSISSHTTVNTSTTTSTTQSPRQSSSLSSSLLDTNDVEVAEFLYSNWKVANQARLQELHDDDQQITAEERYHAMVDMFGTQCAVQQPRKRVKRERKSGTTVSGLDSAMLRKIESELEEIPSYEKLAWLEAKETALASEFSDRRMTLFLQVEDMDAKGAARRIVTYWEERRRLFGADKFYLPMSFDGALRDDLELIETGIMFLLPGVEDSGRQVLVYNVRLHTAERRVESMLRVLWYYLELSWRHPNAAKGTILYVCGAGSSLRHGDVKFVRSMFQLEENVFPARIRATHICHPPRVILVFLKPIGLANTTRDARARTVFHDSPDIVDALSSYGIPSRMVPKEMGGTSKYDHAECFPRLRRMISQKIMAEFDEFDWATL